MADDVVELNGLAAETDFIDRLLATTHAIVLLMDCDGHILFFNDYMAKLGGYPLDEVRGRDWFEIFIKPDDAARLRELYRSAVGGSPIEANVNDIITRAGEALPVEWWANPVHGDAGEILGVVSIGQDISDKLELKAKLAETERLATIGMMASVFAHEVGNPLNSMFLQAQLLRRRIDKPNRGELAPKVDMLLGEIRRLNMLLEDFRSFHSAGKLTLELTDLHAVLAQVIELLGARASERDVELCCEIANDLPHILGNANKLKQVFMNLCKNGFEAMPGGGTLELRAWSDEGRVHVEVVDHGVGIPDDVDVFAPFATTKPSGMGLGLPLVREIIDAHGGMVDYQSKPDHGTTFSVVLPRRPGSDPGGRDEARDQDETA